MFIRAKQGGIKLIYIADCGTSWKDIDEMKSLALRCKYVGVSVFKPQLWSADSLYSKSHPSYEWIKSHELSVENAEEIFNYCNRIKLECAFSAFDIERLYWMKHVGCKTLKIAARMSGNEEFLSEASNLNFDKVFISISEEYKHLSLFDYNDMFNSPLFLSSVSRYPAKTEEYSLETIRILGGLSNHVMDNGTLAIASTAIGAKTIEFHTLQKWHESPDRIVSYHIDELAEIIKKCNNIEKIRYKEE